MVSIPIIRRDRRKLYYPSFTELERRDVPTASPLVTLLSPSDESFINNPRPTFSASASDFDGPGIASVQFQFSADAGTTWTNVGPAQTDAPYSYTPNFDLPEGSLKARAVATDLLGNQSSTSNTVTTLASFLGTDVKAVNPLVRDQQGNLYGTTYGGGEFGLGTVYMVAAGTNVITTIASFQGSNGSKPSSGITIDANGNLFGVTEEGGPNEIGTVFKVPAGLQTIVSIASFNGANGSRPKGNLAIDADGNLYGTTSFGGPNSGSGTIFKLVEGSSSVTTLATFRGANGSRPMGGVALNSSGVLFGTTSVGGLQGRGLVFQFDLSTNTLSTVVEFGASTAGTRLGVTLDSSGNMYGVIAALPGPATIFQIAAGTQPLTPVKVFTGGDYVDAPVVVDAGGSVYGTTGNSVFKIASGTREFSTIARLSSLTGTRADGGVIIDESGNLYGATTNQGPAGYGQVFKIAAGTAIISTVAGFQNPLPGRPSSFVLDQYGNTFGTTTSGGAFNRGTIFKIAAGAHTLETIAFATSSAGAAPTGLVIDSAGNLFGISRQGSGSLFTVAAGSGTISRVANDGILADSNVSGIMVDESGDLYGTTAGGGPNGYGFVFKVPSGSQTAVLIAEFDSNSGTQRNGVRLDGSGNLIGTTKSGGPANAGTIFMVPAGSSNVVTLAAFNGANGTNPFANVIIDSNGDYFGTTFQGGNPTGGTVFRVSAGSGTIETLHSFSNSVGHLWAGLTMDENGNLFGTTGDSYGTVFKFAHGTYTFSTLATLNGANGDGPLILQRRIQMVSSCVDCI